MSESKYGEPWHFGDWDSDRRHIFDSKGRSAYASYPDCSYKDRIVSCVNALAGVPDPAEFMEAARDVIKACDNGNAAQLYDTTEALRIALLPAATPTDHEEGGEK